MNITIDIEAGGSSVGTGSRCSKQTGAYDEQKLLADTA